MTANPFMVLRNRCSISLNSRLWGSRSKRWHCISSPSIGCQISGYAIWSESSFLAKKYFRRYNSALSSRNPSSIYSPFFPSLRTPRELYQPTLCVFVLKLMNCWLLIHLSLLSTLSTKCSFYQASPILLIKQALPSCSKYWPILNQISMRP